MRLFSVLIVLSLILCFQAKADIYTIPNYAANWTYPGQSHNFSLDPGKRVRYVEVTWTDAGGNGIGQLFIDGRSYGARNVGSAQYGVKERWYVSPYSISGNTSARIYILNDQVKIFSVRVEYDYTNYVQPVNPQPIQNDHFNNHHDYFNNTGDYFPKPLTVEQAKKIADDRDNDRYNWPGWYEPGRDYKFKLEKNKKIRKIKIRWYCEEGKARARLYINWHYEGSHYPPKGNYPYYDYIYLWNTVTDDSYWNEGRIEIYYEKVYIDRVEVEYDWNYDPDNSKAVSEPVKIEFEQIEK